MEKTTKNITDILKIPGVWEERYKNDVTDYWFVTKNGNAIQDDCVYEKEYLDDLMGYIQGDDYSWELVYRLPNIENEINNIVLK